MRSEADELRAGARALLITHIDALLARYQPGDALLIDWTNVLASAQLPALDDREVHVVGTLTIRIGVPAPRPPGTRDQ